MTDNTDVDVFEWSVGDGVALVFGVETGRTIPTMRHLDADE